MPSLFPSFMPGARAHKVKRKLSGAATSVIVDMHDQVIDFASDDEELLAHPSVRTLPVAAASKPAHTLHPTASNVQWFCQLCKTIDVNEVLAFMLWEALAVAIVVLAVSDWIFFFKFVVEPEDHRERAQWGGLWVLFTACIVYFRSWMRSKCGREFAELMDHAEIFVTVSLTMVSCANVAFYMHVPSATPLRDIGFMLIPEQADDSKWRPLSDILTGVVPVVFMLQTLFMTRPNRCKVMAAFFRVATINYGLRMITIALTSLPGPAPHCRPGSPLYLPPTTWIDVITRVGPMYGKFTSCGDLIFSGHMAYTNSALLLYLRVLDRHFPRYSRVRWGVGVTYLLVLAGLCISGRKHYTVDIVLGILISTLVFFHFEHSWVPHCLQRPRRRASRRISGSHRADSSCYDDGYYSDNPEIFKKRGILIIEEEGVDNALSKLPQREGFLYRANGRPEDDDPVDFIC
ncbi:TPA: hypothetical protein N0F65_002437 [Lagenidium giganteum]|uniref:Sphingomyelin synthase-like domain-containing protein n=1 Tax=Lagenidium giganteum TaxID=4803 RepID=A0AAV2YJZ6_9STRA|nr:TPA: hypothetical protein N0F65_002437 [Lagenidium giganteum]